MSIDIKVRMRADKGHESTLELLLGDSICCPGTFRDGTGAVIDTFYHPVGRVFHGSNRWGLLIVRGIDTRARYLDQDSELDAAYDPYVLLRDVWWQNRQFQIYDGDPPMMDYELYLEDDFETEEPATAGGH